ncbi:hypothetical protein P8452_64604 [Trifolium repens]|nr:hypothetical protein P8452_64604 [Trifolium repens]
MDTDNSFSMCLPCQMNDIISLVRRVAPYAFVPIQQHVGYLISYEDNLMKLTGLVKTLIASKVAINHRVEAARNNGNRIEDVVQNWLDDVDEVIERANKLLEEDRRRREVGSSGWSFPNLILRHQLGKKATEIADDVAGVQGRRSDFNEVGYLPRYEIGSSSWLPGGEKLETRETFKEDILEALRDPKASNIGIYGLGGVGKTFLVKEIADIAIQQKLFDAVVIPLVSNAPDIEKIQWVIADMLGLKFEEKSTDVRAMRLKERIKAEKSVLIILDDIWQPLELEKVGIPSNKEHIGCKLLMTSRTQDVLLKMHVQKDFTFRLELLSEKETWSLFQSMAEDVVNDISLNNLATQIAKECKGLPLLIVTVASGLKSKDISVWKDALSQLQSVGHVEMEEIARSVLELSYQWLASDEIQAVFLLSAVLGESGEDYLLKVAMGLEIFMNIDTVDGARNKFHSIIESLKESCLLLEGNKRSGYIQMHDLVRDVAISIARRDKHVYMLKTKDELKKFLTKDCQEKCSQIILSQCLLHELPKKLDCPNVKLFVFVSANRLLEIPDTIFDGMGSLKVLDLTSLNLSSLPTSFHSLTDLRTLCLDQCVLGNIDIIADLKNLEILSFWKSSMTKLPIRLREMTQLRMLGLSNAGIEVIPSNIFSSLTKLEVLYLGNISINWEDENSAMQKENASLSELQRLRNLTALELQIHNARILPRVLKSMFEKLKRYKIAIGDVWEWSDIEHTTLNTLMLKLDTNIHSELGIKALIKGVENLYLDEVDGLQNVLYEMNREGFPLLSHLHIQNNAKMKHIVYFDNAAKMKHNVSFPKLETLSINNLENLEKMCHGPLAIKSFGKLSVIKVKNCAKLTYLLSLSMVERLSNLSEIEVCQCNSMKNIVLGDLPDEKVEFRSLRSLTLQHLDKLDNFFSYELMASSITSTRPFFSAQVAFPDLKTLKLSSLNLDKIWDDNQHPMYNLSVLIVENCGELNNLFSSTMVQSFVNLTWLEISKCNLMKEIISTESRNNVTIALNEVPFPKLETIVLKDMENLKTVWHFQFDKVKTLEVQNCEKIVVVIPSSMQKTYHNLEMLVVKDCALVENIFDLSSSENSSIESEIQLKLITLDQLPKLIKIWSRDTQGILSFHNLQNVFLNHCDSMEYLFPFSVATTCPHLEVLEIKNCGKMKEIVSKKTDSTGASPTFEYNQLHTILLWGLHSLKGIYAGNHILACPSLRKLDVYECAKLNLFKTAAPPGSSHQICEDENLSDLFQPLFIVEELIPNLEWMRIDDRDAMMIMQAQNLDSLFNKLTFLGVSNYNNDEATFPYWFLQNALSLEELVVSWSSFKMIFEDETLVGMKIHTRLKKLRLYQLPKLQYICEEGSQIHPVLEVLEYLYVDYCPSLTNLLLPSSVTFSHLTYLEITKCNKLVNLISSSTAQSMVKLTELRLEDCDSLQDIIMAKEDVDIAFVSLQILILKGLPSLNNFCSSKCCLKFPLLEKVVVSNCPLMDIFSEGNTSTPSLRKVKIEENSEEWTWNGNLNDTIKKMFEDKVAFRGLKSLKLSPLNLHKIWNDSQHSMYNLTVLIVENCGELKYLFSSTMVQRFVNLTRLEISNCNLMNEIIATESRNDVTIALNEVPFPKLETIVLKDMENLKTVWHYQFDTVKTLEVQNCEKIVVVFPSSMDKTYHNLEMLVVKDCALVENIFELSSSEISSIESETQLKVITLDQLPKLIKIWSRDTQGILSFHNLHNVFLNQCDSMEYLFPFSVATACPHLEVLEIKYCGKMKEIVSKKTDSTGASPTFVFNQLHTILLWGLHSLKGIYAGNHILACPSLRKLDVSGCPKLNLFKTAAPPGSSLQICEDENLSDFLFQPLFIVEEVIPNLEWMRIDDWDAMMIMQAQNLDSLFNKLTFLGVSNYNNDEATFPYWFLQNAPSLETLVVSWSSFKKIFEDETLVGMKIHTRLKKLSLYQLPKLQHICEEGSQIHPVLEVLEQLFIKYCPSLTNLLLPSSVTFSHLTYLEITKCNKLVNLITSSTAQSLVKLTELKVEDCDSLQEIIMGKENVDIAFVSLEILILKDLPSLNNFCSSKCCLKFPLLELVVVSKCNSMEMFSKGNTSTPSLQKVSIEENSEEWYWKANLNDTIKEMFEDKSLA